MVIDQGVQALTLVIEGPRLAMANDPNPLGLELGYTLSDVEADYCQDVEDSTDASDLHQVPGTKPTTKTTRTDQAEEGQS